MATYDKQLPTKANAKIWANAPIRRAAGGLRHWTTTDRLYSTMTNMTVRQSRTTFIFCTASRKTSTTPSAIIIVHIRFSTLAMHDQTTDMIKSNRRCARILPSQFSRCVTEHLCDRWLSTSLTRRARYRPSFAGCLRSNRSNRLLVRCMPSYWPARACIRAVLARGRVLSEHSSGRSVSLNGKVLMKRRSPDCHNRRREPTATQPTFFAIDGWPFCTGTASWPFWGPRRLANYDVDGTITQQE